MSKIITNELLQAVINYMVARPFQEVHQVIPLLLNLPDYTPPVPQTEEKL